MQLTCNRDTLITAVTPALYAVSVKSTNQAVEGFHLSADQSKGTLTITGYDLQKGIRIVLSDIIVSFGGELVVNAQKFAQIIKSLPDGEVEISADDKNMLTITGGKSIYDISVLNAENYPQIPDFVSEKAFRIKQSVLKQMISETLFAVAVNHSRQTLNGALFEIENDVIKIIGVDGFRLAFRKENGQIAVKDKETSAESLSMKFIVPGKSLSDLQKILRDNDENIDIELSKKQIVVHNGNIMFFSRLLDGEFLDYKKTIPTTPTTKVIVDRKQLIGGIERTAVIMDQNTNPLRMNFVKETGSSSVQISAATTIGKANDSCGIDIDGPDIEIGFNHKFLLEAFKTIRDDKVALKLEGPLRSLVVSSVEERDEPEPKYLYMVLPLRLRSA